MSRSIAAVLAVLLLTIPVVPPLPAQDGADAETAPEPYDPQEFPQWSRDLRRGEIIALGAFPVAMIISGLGYELGRFVYYSVDAGAVQPDYAPGFLTPGTGAVYNSDERVGLIVSGALISVGIAVVDYLLSRRERNAARLDGGRTNGE